MSIRLSNWLHASSLKGSERGLVLKHWCNGCKSYHLIYVEKPNPQGFTWTWNENYEAPTVQPSLNHGPGICHYTLTDGMIHYCGDCQHDLKNQVVALPRIPFTAEAFADEQT